MHRRLKIALGLGAVSGLVIAGCGGGDEDSGEGPPSVVPPESPIYLEALLRPEGTTQQDAEAALGKILDSQDPGAKLVSLVEQAAAEEGEQFSYEQDVAPWLGQRAGLFFLNFNDDADGAVVVESTDNEAAQSFLEKIAPADATDGSYEGAEYSLSADGDASGVVGDFVVFGSETGFREVVDASNGNALGGSDDFRESTDELPEGSLGSLYIQPRDFLDAIPDDEIDPTARSTFEQVAGDGLEDPVVGDLTASADELKLDLLAGSLGEAPQSSLIESAPAQSWLALSAGDLGDAVKRAIDQLRDAGIPNFEENLSQVEDVTGASLDELTDALGDSVFYLQGVSERGLSGALVVQSNDTELTGRLLTQLQGLIGAGAGAQFKELSLPGGGSGFSFSDPTEAPQPFEIAQQGDKIAIAYGAGSAEQALGGEVAAGSQLSATPAFAAAAESLSSLGIDAFLSFPAVFQLAESEGANKDPEYQQAKPYIDGLDYLGVGTGSEGDRAEISFIVGLK